jgi:molybdate/tungstate transport system ATP-binding protein
MTSVAVEGAYASLGDFRLQDISVSVESGEFFVILGPSGAGKTVLLDLIAGFVYPRQGRVLLDGADITFLPTEKRHIGYMFQNYALFPDRSVYKNIEFGLRYAKMADHGRRVEDIMELVGIAKLRDRTPTTLSGGEQQRVALARSLILEPTILLLDEPLSALDTRSRDLLREELRDVIDQFEITALFVTHDQTEARLLADRLGVMYDGRLLQTGSVHQIFDKPDDERVASFVGMENLFEAVVVSQKDGIIAADIGSATIEAVANNERGDKVILGIRPENVTVMLEPVVSSARNTFNGTVKQILYLGPINKVIIDCGFMLAAYVTNISTEALRLDKGSEVSIAFKATGVNVMAKGQQSRNHHQMSNNNDHLRQQKL